MLIYDKINVLDLEATCWEADGDYQREHTEIIEIGICKYVVATGAIEEKRSYYVQPTRSEISPYCTELTGITPERVAAEGTTLAEALRLIKKDYAAAVRVHAGWGDWDRRMILRECARHDIKPRFNPTYWNIKSLAAAKLRAHRGINLYDALEAAGETFEGKLHCGADDAYNTAKLLRLVLG